MNPKVVQALRLESNRFAAMLFSVYSQILRAMEEGKESLDGYTLILALPGETSINGARWTAVVKKLRNDGFSVHKDPTAKNAWRITWNQKGKP